MKRLCAVADLGVREGRGFALGDGGGVLVRTAEGVRAWVNCCPHQGRPLDFAPDQFLFTPEGRLVCPHHGACFDPATGDCTDGPCAGSALTPVAIAVKDGVVWLDEARQGP